MDLRGSKKLFGNGSTGGGGSAGARDHCSTAPRNLPEPIYNQLDKVCDATANSFPRQSTRGRTGSGGEDGRASPCNGAPDGLQNLPPGGLEEPLPLPPRRSTSLFTPGGASTLTLRHSKSSRECSSSTLLNPKRISIATSSFWLDHPDMEKFANTLDFGHETMKTRSVWGTSEQGSGNAESVDIWGDPPAVKKGVLMQQREKLWSRWKERYIILTRDYLNCFRRSANVHRSGVTLSEMGSFIFKLRLADVEEIRWENRRGGSLVALVLPQEPRILLRVPNDNTEALHQWYTLLQECIYMSKERRQALRNYHTSTYGKTYSTTKSNPLNDEDSLLKTPPSSDDTEDKEDITKRDLPDGRSTSQSRRNTSSRMSGIYSTVKSSNAPSQTNGTNGSRRSSARKYSPVVVGDHDDDEDDYDDDYLDKVEDTRGGNKSIGGGGSSGGGTSSSDVDEYIPVTRRRTSSSSRGGGLMGNGLLTRSMSSNLTLNDFIRNPWKGTRTPEEEGSSLEEIAQRTNGTSSPSSPPQTRRLSNSYAIPVDSLLRQNNHHHGGNKPKRPESWSMAPTPGQQQSNLFYRTPTIVPSQWMNKRDLPLTRNAGPPFGRSTMIVCPSRLSAEVTYIRRM